MCVCCDLCVVLVSLLCDDVSCIVVVLFLMLDCICRVCGVWCCVFLEMWCVCSLLLFCCFRVVVVGG